MSPPSSRACRPRFAAAMPPKPGASFSPPRKRCRASLRLSRLGAAFFGTDALVVLTGSAEVARDFHWPFALLAFAFALNGFALIPNALRLSEGEPGTALWSNVAAAVVYLPAIVLLTPRYGVMAPAALWLAANAFIFTVLVRARPSRRPCRLCLGLGLELRDPAIRGHRRRLRRHQGGPAAGEFAASGRGCGGNCGGLGLSAPRSRSAASCAIP